MLLHVSVKQPSSRSLLLCFAKVISIKIASLKRRYESVRSCGCIWSHTTELIHSEKHNNNLLVCNVHRLIAARGLWQWETYILILLFPRKSAFFTYCTVLSQLCHLKDRDVLLIYCSNTDQSSGEGDYERDHTREERRRDADTKHTFFDVLLTVHLSIFISVFNQLDA